MLLLWNSFLGIEEHFLALLLLIDSKIYWAFSKLYSFFISLARLELFRDDAFSAVMNNVYVIFGVVALFVVAFVLLKEMVNTEDTKSGKQISSMLVRMVMVSIIIVLVPPAFDFLYDFQDALLTQGTVQKILFSDTSGTTNSYIEIKDGTNNQYVFTADCQATSYEEALRTCEKVKLDVTDTMEDYDLTSAGYNIGYTVLSGFLSPAEGLKDEEVIVDASDYMSLGKGLKITGIACAVGGGIATLAVVGLEVFTSPASGFATLAAIPGTITAFGGTITAACLGGAALGAAGSALTYAITYDEYKWSDAKAEILADGDFNRITSFAEAITGGEMDYTPVLSTIAGLILLYMIFSFCLDLGVRAAKLAFLEILAPLCLLISIIPSKKDLLNNWLKKVGTVYLEVFIRIFCVCGVALLISKLDNTILKQLGDLAQAVIVLGLVIFAKQIPKFISELTGIDSGNMKLGIKEKLAEGGAFTVGAVIGAGATGFVRNAVNAGKNLKNKFEKGADGKIHRKAGVSRGSVVRSAFGGVGSIIAGTISSQFRTGFKGNAKSASEMVKNASAGAKAAVEARDKRATYKSRHGGNVVGSMVGHVSDTVGKIGKWAGINNIDSLLEENKIIEGIQSLRKAIDNEARDLILGDLEKGKTSVSYDTASHNMTGLRNLKNDIDVIKSMSEADIIARFRANTIAQANATHQNNINAINNMSAADFRARYGANVTKAQVIANANARHQNNINALNNMSDNDIRTRYNVNKSQMISDAETAYTNYLKGWQDEVTNMGLLGTTNWNNLTREQQADLAKLRMATNEYRENVARQINQPYVATLQNARDILDPTKDLRVRDALLDDIKNEMKISQTELQRRINQAKQKEQDKNGGT